ncbi:MAG: response regulator [Candidatus Heimdallarchaeaceae archaeon]
MQSTQTSQSEKENPKKIRILIADDEESVRAIFKLALQAYNVKTAKNGEEAVQISNEWSPDLILMDIKMPIMDGIEATKIIKEKNKEIIIFGISAFGGNYEQELRKLGIANFIRKPIRISKLREMVENALEKEKN